LVPTPLLRLKRCHACDQWHSSRVFTPLTGWHCKLCRNAVGRKVEWRPRVHRTAGVRVLFFDRKSTPDDAIGSHACSLDASSQASSQASRRVTNGIPLGCPLFLPVHTVNCVQTLKVVARECSNVRSGADESDRWSWCWTLARGVRVGLLRSTRMFMSTFFRGIKTICSSFSLFGVVCLSRTCSGALPAWRDTPRCGGRMRLSSCCGGQTPVYT
jgi:hypothetical protein